MKKGISKIHKAVIRNDMNMLNTEELERLNRIQAAHDLMHDQGFTKSQAVKELQKEFGITQNQCYKDALEAQIIYGKILYPQKKYALGLQYESLIDELKKAKEKDDWKRIQGAQKNLTDFMDKFEDILQDDDYSSLLDNNEAPTIVTNPALAGLNPPSRTELEKKLREMGFYDDAEVLDEVENAINDIEE